MDVNHLSPMDKWNLVARYTDNFEQPKPQFDENEGEIEEIEIEDAKTLKVKKSRHTRESASRTTFKSPPAMLFLSLTSIIETDEVLSFSPCSSQPVYVETSRDIPLDPEDVNRLIFRDL